MGDIEELAASYERKLIEVGADSLFLIVQYSKCRNSMVQMFVFLKGKGLFTLEGYQCIKGC